MKWILEHIQVIIAVAAMIAYYLNQRKREKEGLPADYDEDGSPDTSGKIERSQTAEQMEEAERARAIQEELRRKRAERAGETLRPSSLPKPPVLVPAPSGRGYETPPPLPGNGGELMRELAKRFVQPLPEAPKVDENALARQREYEEQIRQLEVDRKKLAAKAQAFREGVAEQAAVDSRNKQYEARRDSAVESLGSSAELRRAIVLNEILGKPVSLRA